jgi:hypothetical protein
MRPTTETSREIQKHVEESVALLKTLRDEIRVELHLAGMEAKERWARLEKRFGEAEKLAQEASLTSKRVLQSTIESFKAFRASLKPPEDFHP